MSLTLYYHPLSSFCHKVLIALYENDTPFDRHIVDLGDEQSSATFKTIWPMGKFPVLRDETRNRVIPESTMIIEFLDLHYPGKLKLVPADPDLALEMRLRDRFHDLYINTMMQKIITDRLRPEGHNDPYGVEQAGEQLRIALALTDAHLVGRRWMMGDDFTMADCATAPALFYADRIVPLAQFANVADYLQRLKERPSFARVLKEAEPYLHLVPAA